MAGGKETPRQKMIGMMYLVLTALLALNVSKEIIAAFVTINDKLDMSGEVVSQSTSETYFEFEKKRLALKTQGGNLDAINLWEGKANTLNRRTKQIVSFILGESNEMIKMAEGGQSWVAKTEKNEDTGEEYITELKSLFDISAMDNYDIPTNRFIGGNPQKPKNEGVRLRDSVLQYRNYVTELMGNYKYGEKEWKFKAPEDISGLREALITANPDDTVRITQVYKALTLPEKIGIKDAGTVKEMPWASAMFDHAPIVAAAAMLTALKVDILNGESIVAEHMLSKVDAPSFNFNKIEPLAFARSSYINPGDSLALSVMIAAYDSTDIPEIRYGVNEDTIPDNWKTVTGSIPLPGGKAGEYKVKGQIGVKEKGKKTWKDWNFRYTVGNPSGTVSLPEMNVLYRGYDNKVTGAASGFPDFKLSGGGNVNVSQKGDYYVAKPGSGRSAKINISGVAADGSSASLGSFEFRVQDMPKPSIRWGALWDGESGGIALLRSTSRIAAMYPPEIPLKADFQIRDWEITVSGAPRPINGNGSRLSEQAMSLVRQAPKGATISIMTTVKMPSGRNVRKSGTFKVK